MDKARQTGKYPTDITLGVLDNDDIAEKYILEHFTSSFKYQLDYGIFYDNGDLAIETIPLLITNDPRLFLLYKGVFKTSDFKYFCKIYDNYQSLNPNEKRKIDKGSGTYQAYEFFNKLIAGEGKCAYEYTSSEEWHDESGNTRAAEVESGWKIINRYSENDDIKKRYNL